MTKLKIIAAVAALIVSGAVHATTGLVGTWKATTTANGALPGTLELRKNKTMVLSPSGEDTYKGTWTTVPPNILKLTIPQVGSSEMTYLQASNNKLTLTYDNGNTQEFERQKSTPKKAPAKQ